MNDVWSALRNDPLPKLLYGMGNGADKILDVCRKKDVGIAGVFASDGFARGNLFHGMPVTDYKTAKERFGSFTVLLSFATSRAEVLENVFRIAREQQLFVPDLPVAGDDLFDGAFYEERLAELEAARSLFADEKSRAVFDTVIACRLTGALPLFFENCTTADEDFSEILSPGRYEYCADLGAYTGDTALDLIARCPRIKEITALEPDPKTFEKLKKNTAGLPVKTFEGAAWSKDETLRFSASGGRGAALGEKSKKTRAVRGVRGDGLFENKRVDYVKFDVEGAELEALKGLASTIGRCRPDLLVSAYHRPGDLFALPLYLRERYPFYRLYLRRRAGLPAWDINLLAVCGD